jgi:hypothetical protein
MPEVFRVVRDLVLFLFAFFGQFFVKLVDKNPAKIRKPWQLAQTNLSCLVDPFYYAFRISSGIDGFLAKRNYD